MMKGKTRDLLIGLTLITLFLPMSCTGAEVVPTATPQPPATARPAPTATSTPAPSPTPRPTETPAPSPTPHRNPSAAIAPTSGDAGTAVQLTANGFPPNTPVEIGAGQANAEYDVVDTAQTDAQGSLSTPVTIPAFAEPGERWVFVVDSEDLRTEAVSNVFEVTGVAREPAAAVSPTTGPPGTAVELVVRGFPANVDVEIGAGRAGSEYDVIERAQTDAQGSLSTPVTIPTFAEPGERWVFVVAPVGQQGEAVSNVFRVTGGGADPQVSIEPTQGPPGSEIEVAAQDFPSNTDVEVGLGVKNTEYWNSQDVRTDATGNLRTTMTIPPSAEPGEHWVAVVRVVRRGGAKAVSPDFVVSRPAAQFRRVDIYLIALGDEGRTGREIGCGDSVLPVEVEIEPTVAPLTAALEALLALEEQEYGRSGLYNALYRSELTLESVDIDAGEAIIHLSGSFNLGGACDIPRAEAQLEETALQFSTVDQVSILVDGQPLDQVLSGQ